MTDQTTKPAPTAAENAAAAEARIQLEAEVAELTRQRAVAQAELIQAKGHVAVLTGRLRAAGKQHEVDEKSIVDLRAELVVAKAAVTALAGPAPAPEPPAV